MERYYVGKDFIINKDTLNIVSYDRYGNIGLSNGILINIKVIDKYISK